MSAPGLPEIRNDRDKWDAIDHLPARAEKYCPWWMLFVRKSDGTLIVFPKPCGSPMHEPCVKKTARRWLKHLSKLIDANGEVFFASVDYSKGTVQRLADRRFRQRSQGVAIRRFDNRLHLYSTRPLPGRKPPTSWVRLSPWQARLLLAFQSFALPGLAGNRERKSVSPSEGWKLPPEEKPTGERKTAYVKSFPDLDQVDEVYRKAAKRVETERGILMPVSPPRPGDWDCRPPKGVDTEYWMKVISEAAEEVAGSDGSGTHIATSIRNSRI